MALIKKVRGIEPVIGRNCYLAETATVIGDTVIGDDCSIWFNTVIWGGVPAKFVKKTDPGQTKKMIEKIAGNYLTYSGWYSNE